MKVCNDLLAYPLPAGCNKRYVCAAYDGSNYFFIYDCCVSTYNSQMEKVDETTCCNEYIGLCFDTSENCFWAVCDATYNRVYQLDHCFREIDCVMLRCIEYGYGNIVGITYNSVYDTLVVVFSDAIVEYNKNGEPRKTIYKGNNKYILQNALCIYPHYMIAYSDKCAQYLEIRDECGNSIDKCRVCDDYRIESILSKVSSDPELYALATKNYAYSYLIRFSFDCSESINLSCSQQIPLRGLEEIRKTIDSGETCEEDTLRCILDQIIALEEKIYHILDERKEST